MSGSSITDFQVEVARVFFAMPEAGSFLLAGGLALAAHGLTERPTEDLDVFTSKAEDVGWLSRHSLAPLPTGSGWLKR